MTNFEIFLAIVSIGWGVLCLILFFKIWKMTDDVNRLTFYVQQLTAKVCGEVKEPVTAKPVSRDFNIGDEVYVIASGEEVKVEKCEGNSYLCSGNWFDASELTRTL
jgi:hypothetical protein